MTKKVHSIRTDPKLKDLENHCRDNLKSKPLSQSMFFIATTKSK